MVYLPFLVMVAALLLGVPIAFSLATAGIVGIVLLGGDVNVVLRILGTTLFGVTADYVLTTIPMFILMAYFFASGGLARDLFTAGANWLSQVKGGLAIATVFACGIFGAMSGASLAAAAVMSSIAMPEMRRHGYSDELAAGAFLAGTIGFAFGRLTWAGAFQALRETIKTSALIFMILIGATVFGYYMAMSKIPQQVVAVVTEMNLNRWLVIVGIVVTYFVVSMFMDELPLLLLTLQLTFPLVTSLGFDPVWFGVMSMLMVAMGLVFPPVGMIAFVVSSSANVSLVKVYTGTSILMIALVLTTALLMVFPQIALWLPNTMK